MTTRRRIARRPSGTRSTPRYTWRYWDSTQASVGGGVALTFILDTLGAAPDLAALGVFGDYTVRRVLGKLFMVSTNATESSVLDHVAWGLIVSDKDAVAAGALPEPFTDAADWFGFGEAAVSIQGSFSASIHPVTEVLIESRAMRKVNENNQNVVLRVEADTANVVSISMVTVGRLLVSHGQR